MAVVVIGGHTRNIGKTSVVAGLIAAMPERRWWAVKITQFGHGVCSANGEPCDCETAGHTIAVSEERERASGTDSSRYLAAGAAKSFWVRTRQGQLQEAMPRVRKLMDEAAQAGSDVIVESNSVLRFLRPDVFVSVVDASVADFKPSALRYLDRADALVLTGGELEHVAWSGVAPSLLRTKVVRVAPPEYVSAELVETVRARLPVLSVSR
ncbi:hypothetical protein SAMN05421819_0138 [Bryocella elongata]|uniref:Molybdopterin-guanine dinucleotide biosynthesis protein B n=1 Tax=Bryocella elongata TaxID=863522 RepID=A0A1H5SB32_9BACT|nr:hypothetical protein [Bryocella elongata]SEF47863.1 hypothetical protein SAMN05421819_0138 [Bryocella elongata]